MKRTFIIAAFLTAVFSVALFQVGCEPANSNAGSSNSNAASNSNAEKKATASTADAEKELMQLERDWTQAILKRDVAAVKRIEADDIMTVFPDGTVGDKAQDIKDLESGALTADSWENTEMKVSVYDPDAAVVRGLGVIKGGKYKGADGKVQDISGEYRFTDTWIKRDGRWQCVASQATTVQKPKPQPTK